MMEALTLNCVQCGTEFVFSGQERERFMAKGFGVPKRCPECRKKKAKGIQTSNDWRDITKRRRSRRKENYDFFEL
ncbi:MAG: zinc-ribbon domain containing protein [Thermodesulfobacteriota bacterium]|nr:zinc-ribbon domain containing protein [Thermodesulfobacteriota bacterium]